MADFRVKMKTKDGVVVQNRLGSSDCWIIKGRGVDHEFAEYSLKLDAAQKGVRLISYEVTEAGVTATVEWL